MMDIEKNKLFRYIAGGCFAGAAIYVLVDLIKYGFFFWSLIALAGYALISVSMFASVPILTSAGAGIHAILVLRNLISHIGLIIDYGFDGLSDIYMIFSYILSLAYFAILIIAGINKKSAKQFGSIAGGVELLRFIFSLFRRIVLYGKALTFLNCLSWAFTIIGAAMVGMALENMPTKPIAASAPTVTVEAHPSASMSSQFERLAKLKEFLDSGVISQEEFEAKKKEILNQ